MKKFGKLSIKKGTVLLLNEKKNIQGGANTCSCTDDNKGNICAPLDTYNGCNSRVSRVCCD
jgi:hypothetical protein